MITRLFPERESLFDVKITKDTVNDVLEKMAENKVNVDLTYTTKNWCCSFTLWYMFGKDKLMVKGACYDQKTLVGAVSVALKMYGEEFRKKFNQVPEEYPELELLK